MHRYNYLMQIGELFPYRRASCKDRCAVNDRVTYKSQVGIAAVKCNIIKSAGTRNSKSGSGSVYKPPRSVLIIIYHRTAVPVIKSTLRTPVSSPVCEPAGIGRIQFTVILSTDALHIFQCRAAISVVYLIPVDPITFRNPVIPSVGTQPHTPIIHVP